MLRAHDAVRHIQHTLSTDEIPAVGAMRIINDAGEFLCNTREWKWLETGRTQLDFRADEDYVWLPRDFRDLLAYDITEGLTQGLSLTTFQYLTELRTSAITTSTWRYWGAITNAPYQTKASLTVTIDSNPISGNSVEIDDGYSKVVTFTFTDATGFTETVKRVPIGATKEATLTNLIDAINESTLLRIDAVVGSSTDKIDLVHQLAGEQGNNAKFTDSSSKFTGEGNLINGLDPSEPRPRIELWPTPATNDANAVTIFYRAGWKTVEDLDENLNLPSWLESVYLQLLRAFARGYERESEASTSARVAEIIAGPLFLAAVNRDKVSQPDYGPMMGGAAETVNYRKGTQFWNYNTVSGPN